MRVDFAGSCPKDPGEPGANEDAWAASEDGSLAALCDGASESYDSRAWAAILARRWIADPEFGPEWIASSLAAYMDGVDLATMSWSQQAGFERGSFSTLLGLEHIPARRSVEALAVGDCVAILADGDRMVEAWPFADPERFKERPTLLSTLTPLNEFVAEHDFRTRNVKVFELAALAHPRVFCMSDALAEWALRREAEGEPGIARLAAISNEDELRELVVAERAAKRLRLDDSTLAVLSFPEPEGAGAVSRS